MNRYVKYALLAAGVYLVAAFIHNRGAGSKGGVVNIWPDLFTSGIIPQ